MTAYDKYYQTPNLFGEPYPELIQFFENHPHRGKVLDLGCGQGRDSIAIASLGYEVLGIDISKTGIEQLNQLAKSPKLLLEGKVQDIYTFDNFEDFDIILLDSMFHFTTKDKEKEVKLIQKILKKINLKTFVVFCIQDSPAKIKTLTQTISSNYEITKDQKFVYTFEDSDSGHKSQTNYRMIVIQKQK